MKRQNFTNVLISALAVWIFRTLFVWLTCGFLFTWIYALPPTDIWIPKDMMSSPQIFFPSLLSGFLSALIFVSVFSFFHNSLPDKGVGKGFTYGFIIWLVSSFSGLIGMPFYLQINEAVIAYWILQALVINLVSGYITASLYNQK